MKSAILFGVTGLIGNELLRQIVDDGHYEDIKVFVRNNIRLKNLHATAFQIDFEKLEEHAQLVTGDDCFCCLGSTMKRAGSKENFRKVDFDLVVKIAQIASQNGVKQLVVISSVGANARSSNFYLRTKGEMEEAIQKFSFEKLTIVRPSVLVGHRREFRVGERTGIFVARIFSPFMLGPWKKYRPIHVKMVVRAILRIVNSKSQQIIYESNELNRLARIR